jgi:hypothetical protein
MTDDQEFEIELEENEPMSETYEERQEKFGLWADTEISVEPDDVVKIVIDRPLPDRDKVTIETDSAKAAAMIAKSVAGTLMSTGKDIKFLDGE